MNKQSRQFLSFALSHLEFLPGQWSKSCPLSVKRPFGSDYPILHYATGVHRSYPGCHYPLPGGKGLMSVEWLIILCRPGSMKSAPLFACQRWKSFHLLFADGSLCNSYYRQAQTDRTPLPNPYRSLKMLHDASNWYSDKPHELYSEVWQRLKLHLR